MNIKSISDRSLLLARVLCVQALTTTLNKHNIRKIIELDNLAIELTKNVPATNPDKLSILAGRHYHRFYIAKRFGTKDSSRSELRQAIQIFQNLHNEEQSLLFQTEPGIIEGIKLQMTLIKRQQANDPVTDEELACHKQMCGDGTTSKLITLNLAEWIRQSLIKAGHKDQAHEFTAISLIDHAKLYETHLFRRLADSHRKSKQLT